MHIFNYLQLAELLDVTNPLLMLDIAQIEEDGVSATARKAVSMGEAFFGGHFPGQPIMPGVLQVAAMTQLSRLLFRQNCAVSAEQEIVLKQMRRIKFRKPVLPGDVLTVTAKMSDGVADGERVFQVSCTSEAGTTSAGQLTLALINKSDYEFERTVTAHAASPYAEKMATAECFNITRMMELLPHRPPFLLIDRGYGIGAEGEEVWGFKNITGNDILLAGSATACFPNYLLIESGAQLGCAHVLSQPDNRGKLGIFLSIDEANFYSHLRPGDQLVIHAQCKAVGHAGTASGDFYVDDHRIADCQLKFIIADKV